LRERKSRCSANRPGANNEKKRWKILFGQTAADDPLALWRERMLDAFDGLA